MYSNRCFNRFQNAMSRLVGVFAIAGALAYALDAQAQSTAIQGSTNAVTVSVTPAVADAGVARTLKIDGVWPHACPPTGAYVSAVRDGVTVQLIVPETLVACAQVLTPYSVSLQFTPDARARIPVMVFHGGQLLGEGVLDTRAPDTQAQSTALLAPTNVVRVSVTPVVADRGVVRTIKIDGLWHNGCPPSVGQVVPAGIFEGSRDFITVRLFEPLTLVACTQAITPYSLTVEYTPDTRARQRLIVLTQYGQYLGEGVLDTRAPDDAKAQVDITGVWYDPATNGSGLTFVQSAATNNLVFGTWYIYSQNGTSRWYTIQNTAWQSQGSVLVGGLYEARGKSVVCPTLAPACPVGLASASTVGTARFTLRDRNNARIEALSASGALLFASDITRIQIGE